MEQEEVRAQKIAAYCRRCGKQVDFSISLVMGGDSDYGINVPDICPHCMHPVAVKHSQANKVMLDALKAIANDVRSERGRCYIDPELLGVIKTAIAAATGGN